MSLRVSDDHYPWGFGVAYLGLVILVVGVVLVIASGSPFSLGAAKLGFVLSIGGGIVSIVHAKIAGRRVNPWVFIPMIFAIIVMVAAWLVVTNIEIAI